MDSPEAKLIACVRPLHLRKDELNYLLSLLQEARGLGAIAGMAFEREACARIAEAYDSGGYDPDGGKEIAATIRSRTVPQ